MVEDDEEWVEMHINSFLRWVRRLFLLITFPFRRFSLFFSIAFFVIIILLAIPMYHGVKMSGTIDWYREKLFADKVVDNKESVKVAENSVVENSKESDKFIVKRPTEIKEADEKGVKEYAKWNVAEFNKVKYKPKKTESESLQDNVIEKVEAPAKNEEVENQLVEEDDNAKEKTFSELKTEPRQEKAVEESATETGDTQQAIGEDANIVKQNNPMPQLQNLINYYRRLRNSDLEYLSEPEVMFDYVKVGGPNSVYINDTFVYLYGIYSDPAIYDENAGTEYLRSLTEGKRVRCDVIAYTVQTQSATALCFVNDIFINKAMVSEKHASNVALR